MTTAAQQDAAVGMSRLELGAQSRQSAEQEVRRSYEAATTACRTYAFQAYDGRC